MGNSHVYSSLVEMTGPGGKTWARCRTTRRHIIVVLPGSNPEYLWFKRRTGEALQGGQNSVDPLTLTEG